MSMEEMIRQIVRGENEKYSQGIKYLLESHERGRSKWVQKLLIKQAKSTPRN